jgi:acyl-CoA dehydrogenase
MSTETSILADASRRMFADICSTSALLEAEKRWPADMWQVVEAAGYPLALVPESEGGIGISLAEALAIAQSAGEFGLPLPLAETMLANWILSEAGIETRPGPLALSILENAEDASLVQDGNEWRLGGLACRIPGARFAQQVVICLPEGNDRCRVAVVPMDRCNRQTDQNLAGEARDEIKFDLRLKSRDVANFHLGVMQVRALAAALRCAQMAGALDRVLAITVDYAQNRIQFGRSLGKFQAVQQSLAVLASHAAAAQAAVDLAADGIANGPSILSVAAAKVRIGEAAGLAAAIAHQVHGAFGFTYEHNLHLFTRRLLSWREEFGNERYWSSWLGRRVVEAGADQLWPIIAAL